MNTYFRGIYNFFRKVFRFSKRLRKYLPILWNSEDWDYKYAIDLFAAKLEDIATFLESENALSSEAKYDARRIRRILRLMEKVYREEYATSYFSDLEEIYGKGIMDFEEEDGHIISFNYKYNKLPNREEIEEKKNELFWKSQRKQEKAHKLLWKLIESDIRRWWD